MEDEWWLEAGMSGFEPNGDSYRPDLLAAGGNPVVEASIEDVEPLLRQLSHGVFHDGGLDGYAKQRVVNILRGFREGTAIPPVDLTRCYGDKGYVFRLYHGAHRFYCSVAAGFTHVPAI